MGDEMSCDVCGDPMDVINGMPVLHSTTDCINGFKYNLSALREKLAEAERERDAAIKTLGDLSREFGLEMAKTEGRADALAQQVERLTETLRHIVTLDVGTVDGLTHKELLTMAVSMASQAVGGKNA